MISLGVLSAILAAFGLACQTISTRLATQEGRSMDVVLVVILINVVLLVPMALIFGDITALTWQASAAFVCAGIVGTLIGRACFFAGIKRIGASRADPIKASMPLYATILAVILLGESISGPQLVGIVFIVLGVFFISLEGSAANRAAGKDVAVIGLALPMAAAFFYALEPIFASIGFKQGGTILAGLAVKSLTGVIIFLLYLRVRGSIPVPSDIPAGQLRWYLLAGFGNTGFMLAYYIGLSVSQVSIVVPIMQTSPLLVIAISSIYLRDIETVTPRIVGAAGVIIIGAISVTLG